VLRVPGRVLPPQLPSVVRSDKELDRAVQGMDAARETPRFAGEARQIVAQVRVPTLHRVGLAFIADRCVPGRAIHQVGIHGEAITVVRLCLGCGINQILACGFGSVRQHRPADIAVRGAIHQRYDVGFVFLVVMKVYNASISTVSTCGGTGGRSGSWSAAAVTQLITV
jgi:hypothetical protein